MLSQMFKLKVEVSKEHLKTFRGQCGAVLNSIRGFNMSKQLSKKIRGPNLNKEIDRPKQLSNRIRGATGLN